MPSNTVEVTVNVVRIKTLSSGSLKAFADVELQIGSDVIQLKSFKVMDGSKGLWVATPSQPGKTVNPKTNKIDYFPTMEFSQSLEFAIKDAVLAAYESGTTCKSQIPSRSKGNKPANEGHTNNNLSSSSSNEEDIPF